MNNNIKNWLIRISQKPEIEIEDLDHFAELFVSAYEQSRKLYESSEVINDVNIKTSLCILALEELAKPIILADLIPPAFKKWSVSIEYLKSQADQTKDHSIKQIVSNQYGTITNNLNYKVFLSEDELGALEQLKQQGFYTTLDPQNGRVISAQISLELCNKLNSLVNERLNSFFMYKDTQDAKIFIRSLSLINFFEFKTDYLQFVELSDFDNCKNYQDIANLALEFNAQREHPVFAIDASDGNLSQNIINMVTGVIMDDKRSFIEKMNKPSKKFQENIIKIQIIITKELNH
jgi:AbiV family abortive infection protein